MKENTTLDVIICSSIRDIVSNVNRYNAEHPSAPITKNDIVTLFHDNGTYFLLFFK